jgi:hypothetical protein
VFSGFGISKRCKEVMLTLRVVIQDEKQNDEKPRTAELWPDELTNLFRGKISTLKKKKKKWN